MFLRITSTKKYNKFHDVYSNDDMHSNPNVSHKKNIEETMLKFNGRRVNRQGGSYMISLPMPWIQTMGTDMRTVTIEMDSENSLKIVAGDVRQDNPGHNHYSKPYKEGDEQ